MRAIWLWHLSPHWSPGVIRLIWLARWVSPSSFTAPCASLPKLRARSKRTTIPDRGGLVFGQGYTSSCAPLLEPPNKLSRMPFSDYLFIFFSIHRVLSCFFFLNFWLCCIFVYLPLSMWNLSSQTRDQTSVPCIGRQILNHWTTRGVPQLLSCFNYFLK